MSVTTSSLLVDKQVSPDPIIIDVVDTNTISTNTVCNIPLEDFTKLFDGLKLTDKCPSCTFVGSRHLLKDVILAQAGVNVNVVHEAKTGNEQGSTAGGNSLLDPVSLAFMRLRSELPEFAVKTGDVRTFLKGLELVKNNMPGIPDKSWPRVFLFTVKEQAAREWITTNIINTQLDWTEAKQMFNIFRKQNILCY